MKTKQIINRTFLVYSLAYLNLCYADWHDRKAEGWIWYEENQDPKISHKNDEKSAKLVPDTKTSLKQLKKDPEKELEAFKKELERSLKVATWDPSPENVAHYQTMQLVALEKSIEFGRVWQQNLLNYPNLDASIDSPSSYYGNHIQKSIRQQEKERYLKELAETYALLFFYEGGSLSSQSTCAIVKNFAEKYQFELYGMSTDQQLITTIHNQPINQQLIESIKLTVFPSLFLVDPDNNQLIPIAYGMVAQEKIEDNILLQLPEAANE